jgi:class 3 adenylate cyclase/tetratricopeptide (TPR) repeat protein
VVTVLFSDVTGSTMLGTELDPESLRRLMARFFAEMKSVLQRHGGTTEKFIGDAVMAVFGVPRLHEDDALRAVRAAVEMRESLGELNEEFERTWGVRILTRTGVNTGEVISGDAVRGESFVVGDAVNVAARLEQAAEPGEILVGESTFRLVRGAAHTEALPPLSVKGKSEPLSAWRVLDVTPGAPGWVRRLDSPLVGRDVELRAMQEAFRGTVDGRQCELVTLMAPAGVGKSRLAAEFLSGLGRSARVISGRCLPYGEGITFWPVVEVLRDAAGISGMDSPEEARPKLMELLEPGADASLIGERLAALLGLSSVRPGIQETFWSVRKLMEELAGRRPLVVVFEDIHWGEPTFLDLLEYLVDWIRGVPMLLICLARPELLELRGAWMAGKSNASLVTLAPLTGLETDGLIRHLLEGGELAPETRDRIALEAEGNPLFVEEMLRMLVDDGLLERTSGSWKVIGDLSTLRVPGTIQALLTARLDRLDDEERAVIERASVIGRTFFWGAVSELSPPDQRARVGAGLQSLTRKELIRPDQSELSAEDAFRFAHILVRDAAYQGIPKATRAELHERFANWLEAKAQDRAGEYEEIVGYHLERAFRSLLELGLHNEKMRALGSRAAVQLASAGRRAFARGDMSGSVNLLIRAVDLSGADDPGRVRILLDLAFALLETGDFTRMQEVVAETSRVADTSGDLTLRAQAMVRRLWLRVYTDPEGWADEAFHQANRAISTFEAAGDQPGMARGWALVALVHLLTCQFAESEEEWERAAKHAHAAGNTREELEYLSWVPLVVWGGPTPVADAIRKCKSVLERSSGDRKAMSTALFVMAKHEAMRGRFVEARALIVRARVILEEVAIPVWRSGPLTQMHGWVEVLAGDAAAAEPELRRGVETLRDIGEFSWLSTVAGILAEALYQQDRDDDAEEFLRLSEETAGSEDAYSQGLLRSIRAKLLARGGSADVAIQTARDAVAILERTDFLFLKGFALLSLGEVLLGAGRSDEATQVLTDAARVCQQKGFTVGVARAKSLQGEAH